MELCRDRIGAGKVGTTTGSKAGDNTVGFLTPRDWDTGDVWPEPSEVTHSPAVLSPPCN